VRSPELAARLAELLVKTGEALGLHVITVITDGSQPVGFLLAFQTLDSGLA
jgi:thymidine phosphorylase